MFEVHTVKEEGGEEAMSSGKESTREDGGEVGRVVARV